MKNQWWCKYCNKNLTSKIRLQTHQETCIAKYKHIIEQLTKENKDCKEKIAEKDKRTYELETENIELE